MIPPVLPTYARAPIAFERGEGTRVYTADGQEYLDFGAGVAVTSCGHAHPHLVEALTGQARKIWHTSNLYQMPGQEKLARRLTEATFADTVFFTNSGAEALECAIKMTRKYHAHHGHPERFRIITFEGAFHGRTLATIAAGGQAKYLEGFGPKVEGFDQVPFGDHDALKSAIGPETAGILIEPVQGEGGIRPVPPQCLRG
ncbi:MAG: aminotransferase class III-fold pyridoxal phosphate-dependent enzyme, partial [Aestuariivirga sp.]